jgi:Xaa-Pro aminopeptidase
VLEDPEIRRQHHDTVVWDRVDTLRGFGGIRIEDNVLILEGGHEVLTRAIPKD